MNSPSFWTNLFNPAGFMPRSVCGIWTPELIMLHNGSDFFIWTAYLAIPLMLGIFVVKRRQELPFHRVVLLFGLFIVSCGTTHFMEIVMFYWPVYRAAGLLKFVTAVVSWATVVALIPVVPQALAMKSPEVLQREIDERLKAEEQVRELNAVLEDRVKERTAELEAANHAKDELLRSEKQARLDAEKAQRETDDARLQAEGASRAKDEFLMTLSHELRTPLNAIQGWASLLSGGQLDEADQKLALETIDRSTWAQAKLVDDILEMSRIITGKMLIELKPLNLVPVAREAMETMASTALAKEITLRAHFETESALVTGDAARTQQMVWNLLSNAIKFTPRGGQVDLTLRKIDSTVEIDVTDSGEGIAPDFLPHVFERFQQADSSSTRRHGGLGLGLALVRHLIELHGGQVRAFSAGLGQGATFTLIFPVQAQTVRDVPVRSLSAAPEVKTTSTSSSSDVLKGLHIMVVDDEEQARTLVSAILSMHGAQIQTADSAQEAWEIAGWWTPDLLISDIGMPREDGRSLIARFRSEGGHLAHIPALALTAYAGAEDKRHALEAGFDAHLSKPVLPETLVREATRLCGKALP